MAHTFSPKKQTNENKKKNNNSSSNKYNNDNDDDNNNNNILIKKYITLKPKKIKKVYASALKRPCTLQEYGDYLLGWRLDKL